MLTEHVIQQLPAQEEVLNPLFGSRLQAYQAFLKKYDYDCGVGFNNYCYLLDFLKTHYDCNELDAIVGLWAKLHGQWHVCKTSSAGTKYLEIQEKNLHGYFPAKRLNAYLTCMEELSGSCDNNNLLPLIKRFEECLITCEETMQEIWSACVDEYRGLYTHNTSKCEP